MYTDIFDYGFSVGSALDIGILRDSNQDRVIKCPDIGFFAVSDGMGGLAQGGRTSEIIAEVLPGIIYEILDEIREGKANKANKKMDIGRFGAELKERMQMISDNIYDIVNRESISFGATLSCVWLIEKTAVYVNLGDSRGYLLPRYRRSLKQVTDDHNVAGELVRLGEITKEEAEGHPASSRLTQFIGMPSPAHPEIYIEPVKPGDRILVCSDGLFGMLKDRGIVWIMRSSKSVNTVCERLVTAANKAGGHDNISAIYIKIEKGSSKP